MKESWSSAERRKRSKDCSSPRGFTMRQFCRNQKTRSSPGERKNESLVRSVVRSMLMEAMAPNFASSVTHSAGWISPQGDYYYEPQKRDHGEWAAWEISRNPQMMEELIRRLEDMAGSGPDLSKMSQEDILNNLADIMVSAGKSRVRLPAGRSIEDLYYSDAQSEVRSVAMKMLLEKGWGKISNAYSIEIWKPTRAVLDTWLFLGMDANSDPEKYHEVFGKDKSWVEGDSYAIQDFMEKLP